MSYDLDPKKLCRDEDCEIEEVHKAHRRLRRRPVLIHHRPKRHGPLLQRNERLLPSPTQLIAERVLNAVGDRPMMMQWISRDVRDDYGSVTDRTIYRYVRKLINKRLLIKLDLGLAFAVYIRPTSKLLQDRGALREYILANADHIPMGAREAFV